MTLSKEWFVEQGKKNPIDLSKVEKLTLEDLKLKFANPPTTTSSLDTYIQIY
jgi:hypothetical protein